MQDLKLIIPAFALEYVVLFCGEGSEIEIFEIIIEI